MSNKQVFEQALADVKQIKKMAEDAATRAVLEAVTPRIHDFIEGALLQEDIAVEPEPVELTTGDSLVDLAVPTTDGAGAAISPPDAEGKVTLDIDALCDGELGGERPGVPVPPPMFGEPAPKPVEDEFEINFESVKALQPLLQPRHSVADAVNTVVEHVKVLQGAGDAVRGTRSYQEQIARMIAYVQDTYDYVQEHVVNSTKKTECETLLESNYQVLTGLQEPTTMSKKMQRGRMSEADLTLKLTGLPDDVEDNLDSVGVDLVTGEEGDDTDMGGDLGAEGEEGGDGADLDLDAGTQGTDEDEDTQMENRRLSDDTIVEIDENMLRREIARMRNLREETKPAAWGDGPGGANILDDFGGGKDEGDAVDQEISDLSPAKGARPLGEADDDQDDLDEGDQDQDDLDEQDQDMDQAVHPPQDMAMTEMDDDLDQLQNRRAEDEYGHGVADDHESPEWNKRHHEAVRRLNFEKKLQEHAKARARALKQEAARVKKSGNAKRLAEIKREYSLVTSRFNESLVRSNKQSKLANLAARRLQEARSNSAAGRPAGNKVNETLRKKLAETNLYNAKLLFTNKLLQSTQLTERQKAQVIRQLDEARTVREAKLVYTGIVRTLGNPAKTIREGTERPVVQGSSSRTTRPASTQTTLNEGVETERWAKLAGIIK